MPQISPPKIPLPGVVSAFTYWLLLLAISAGVFFLYALTSGAFSLASTLIILAFICLATIPIADLHNRTPRAIVSSKIASAVFFLLTFFSSFSIKIFIGDAEPPTDRTDISLFYSPDFIWLTSMGLVFTSTLLLSFFFYVHYSSELKRCLNVTISSQEYVSLPLGALATLSLITVALSLRFILGITFFANSSESEALPFALLVSLPHCLIAVSFLRSFIKKVPSPTFYFRLGSWIAILLIMMASRNYLLGMYGNTLPVHLIPIFSIFLYVLPNTLIVALPLVWWGLRHEKSEFPLKRFPPSSFIGQLIELPLPLTIALLYVGFQGFLFACNGINAHFVSIENFASDLQNALFPLFGVGQQNGTSFFAIGMLPFSLICIFTTLKNPYQGILLCRIFCLFSALLHGISMVVTFSLNFPAIEASPLFLSESTLYCFASIVTYVAFSVIHTILLLPHEEKVKESIQPENGISEENTSIRHEEMLFTNDLAEQKRKEKVSQEATPYLDRVRPQLSKWLLLFIPQKGQPLPIFLFLFFCFVTIAKWLPQTVLKAYLLSFSPAGEDYDLAQSLFFLSLVGTCLPALGVFFIQKQIRAKAFSLFLSFWIMSIILLGSYAVVPSFSLLTPEAMGIIAMMWYSKNSPSCKTWFKKESILS